MSKKELLEQIADVLEMQAQLINELSKLIRTLSSSTFDQNIKKYYSVKEASKLLSVSEATVRRLCNDGTLDHVKLQGKILIPVEAIETFKTRASRIF